MHTSFTGHARKSRQVNLSGRSVPNPWAALSGSGGPPTQTSGTHNTIANAQADRLRRQHERDRQTAAKKIQKTWRGHAARQAQKRQWRQVWDLVEQKRLSSEIPLQYNEMVGLNLPYLSAEICLSQIQTLCRFANAKDDEDISRLLILGGSLRRTMTEMRSLNFDEMWKHNLSALNRLAMKILATRSRPKFRPSIDTSTIAALLDLGTFINKLTSSHVPYESVAQFHVLGILLYSVIDLGVLQPYISDFSKVILSESSSDPLIAYESFALEILRGPEMLSLVDLNEFFTDPLHQIHLSRAISTLVTGDVDQTGSIDRYLWMLAYLLHIRKKTKNDMPSFRDWIKAISALLSRCANSIAMRLNESDESMANSGELNTKPLPPFVREQISNLAQQQNVEFVVQQLQSTGGKGPVSVSDIAKPLANYALAILRAFPDRALHLRMWLYRSSPPSGTASLSTIQYLWQAAKSTNVFQRICRDSRSVLSVLTQAAPEHNQIGRAPVSAQEIAVWQEEWRLILLFLELYSFILKIMDDEEFFALEGAQDFATNSRVSQFSQGALPLDDVMRLTTFLKSLAFPLYWNAADLAETNEIEEVGAISALFGSLPLERARQTDKKTLKTLAGNGVSQAYMKERVTALLRMLHERDSRRRFLPDDYWLMTNHVDMQGFISAVVVEEERRNEVGEDSDEDQDSGVDDDDSLEAGDSVFLHTFNMFGIRPPHTSRSRTSRLDNKLDKRRERERKRRQAESLVPRIEILRNLPFFIPFDTRVQIFREFVYRDQYRRRHGWVDPDEWRFSMANGAQGFGLDTHTRGMEFLGRHQARINRGSVFQDAYESFYEIGEGLKEPIQISFIDRFGSPEAGIDGGGVTKEFLISVTNEAFDPHGDMPMFIENEQRLLYPSPRILEWTHEVLQRQGIPGEEADFEMRGLLRRYEFLGRIVGKCMYEGILVDLHFAGFFLLKWALTGGTTSATNETAYRASINDLRDYDNELYQGLLKLKNYAGNVEADFGLDFTASDSVEMTTGKNHTWTKELLPNGSNTAVTNGNRLLYIDKITRYRLQQQPAQVTNAFLRGLGQIIQPMWLAMFNQRELQKLVGGDSAELDINDLRQNTQYGGLYTIGDDGLEHPTVALFWKVLRELDDADRRKVLKFVTSTPRAPLLGFGNLNPKFSIRDSTEDQSRLPSTSTCVNLLKLPRYMDEKTMREKLLYAVNAGAGFDLS